MTTSDKSSKNIPSREYSNFSTRDKNQPMVDGTKLCTKNAYS